jgi:protein-S-isoprenylcysteine O-methyltransferase Ste14
VKPLAVHGGAAETLFWLCVVAWAVFEVALRARAGGGGADGRDLSPLPLTISAIGGFCLGVLAADSGNLVLPGPGWGPVVLGGCIFASGLALRAWAARELGRFFKFTVVVQAGHRVIDTGPYRVIRHPSYSGLLMAELGLGIMLGTWLSIPACVLPPLLGFCIRLVSEERFLVRELGEPYRAYMRRTRRLVPGVW